MTAGITGKTRLQNYSGVRAQSSVARKCREVVTSFDVLEAKTPTPETLVSTVQRMYRINAKIAPHITKMYVAIGTYLF